MILLMSASQEARIYRCEPPATSLESFSIQLLLQELCPCWLQPTSHRCEPTMPSPTPRFLRDSAAWCWGLRGCGNCLIDMSPVCDTLPGYTLGGRTGRVNMCPSFPRWRGEEFQVSLQRILPRVPRNEHPMTHHGTQLDNTALPCSLCCPWLPPALCDTALLSKPQLHHPHLSMGFWGKPGQNRMFLNVFCPMYVSPGEPGRDVPSQSSNIKVWLLAHFAPLASN
jgi:hypothetical protein